MKIFSKLQDMKTGSVLPEVYSCKSDNKAAEIKMSDAGFDLSQMFC